MNKNISPRLSLFPLGSDRGGSKHLIIGGCDSIELAKQYGTPLYVFDETTMRTKCREFTTEFTRHYPNTLVTYASKAFINRALAAVVKEEGLGLDIVSGGELSVAQSVTFPPDIIYFHGNNKTPDELKQAMRYRVGRIVIDNDFEIEVANRIAGELGIRQNILLRLNPGIDPHTHRYTSTGILDSKFGFPIGTGHARRAAIAALAAPNLKLIGLHFHLGSPIAETTPYELAIETVMKFISELKDRQDFEIREFSVGGGFAVPYTIDSSTPSTADYAKAISSRLISTIKKYGLPTPKLTIEPGRAIVAQAGVALYTVGSIKDIPGVRRYVCVDGGMADNIRPALYEAKYEAVVANKLDQADSEKITISGRFCESGDLLVKDILLPPISPGDIIAIPVSGAYCIPMSSNYNMVPRPAIVLVNNGRSRIIRKRESYEDLLRLDMV
jgi:diaminopimelate decarboxylase